MNVLAPGARVAGDELLSAMRRESGGHLEVPRRGEKP